MGLFGRLLGIEEEVDRSAVARRPSRIGAPVTDPETQALERYRYMLRTAPPETLEQAHAEAFAKLAPEQRRQVLAERKPLMRSVMARLRARRTLGERCRSPLRRRSN